MEGLVGSTLPYALSVYAKLVAPTTNEFVKGSLEDILVPWGIYNLSSSMRSTPLFNAIYPLAIYFTYETLQGFDRIPGVFDP